MKTHTYVSPFAINFVTNSSDCSICFLIFQHVEFQWVLHHEVHNILQQLLGILEVQIYIYMDAFNQSL
jgi:hypothetical protein